MTVNLCTVSDYNYLIKGLTLYESLLKHSKDFVLYYLCIDDKSYEKLKVYECLSLKVIHVNDLLDKDQTLQLIKDTEYKYFCWSLASYFTNYLMLSNIGDITYIDSDIYFHDDFNKILEEIGDRQVGIFRHRQFELFWDVPSGNFNVGVVHFKNQKIGRRTLDWWCDAVLNKKYPHLAKCGDQKYLEAFLELGDYLYVDDNIGHGAPWQWQLYDFSNYKKNKTIIWGDKEQKLIFTHFSQFEILNDGYIPSKMHHIYTPLDEYSKNQNLKIIYDEYYNNLKITGEKYCG